MNVEILMNFEEIKELIKIFDDSSISKIGVESGDFKLNLEKGGSVVVTPQAVAQQVVETQPAVETPKPKAEKKSGTELTSPMVGTFYKAPAPNAKAFVKVGDRVSKGQTIGILEAMKIMNEWEAEFDCKILDILVDDGQAVEFGTPIFLVEKI
jgi:acetyl-CoA carboxylase biotin carboxyl carrier protein